MTAPDLERSLREVARKAVACRHSAIYLCDSAPQAGPMLEALTGFRMSADQVAVLGPHNAAVAQLSACVSFLCSMVAAGRCGDIDVAGILDELRAVPDGGPIVPVESTRLCLRCRRPFTSDGHGHRICDACAPSMQENPFEPL